MALPDLAVQAAWMHAACLQQMVAQDKKHLPAALTALAALKQDFPGSEQAAKAEFAITRLRQSHASPEQSLAELSKVPSSDPNYAAAQYEICQLRYQIWNKAKADPSQAAPRADELLKSVDRFLAAAAEGDAERRLKATLLAVDVLSQGKSPDDKRIGGYLKSVQAAAESVGTDPAAAEYHYRRLQRAQRAKDEATIREAAEWIATNAAGSRYALPALVVVAREADRAVTDAKGDRQAKLEQARQTYARLVELLGDSPEVLAANKNALAAASKLAEYDELLGHWPEAAERLGKLLTAFPSDKQYLRRRGLALVQVGEHAAALDCWRKLIGGLASGSEPWLEARYYQLQCLLVTDRPAAEKVWRQFRLLFPEVKSPAWKDKFEELAKEFE